MCRSIDYYHADPGGQATFCGGPKIVVLIWRVFSSKGLSTSDVQKVVRKKDSKEQFF